MKNAMRARKQRSDDSTRENIDDADIVPPPASLRAAAATKADCSTHMPRIAPLTLGRFLFNDATRHAGYTHFQRAQTIIASRQRLCGRCQANSLIML